MKRAKKFISMLIIMAMLIAVLPTSAFAKEETGTDETLAITNEVKSAYEIAAENGNTNIPLSDWLKYMPDDLPISRINMLASHDTGCYIPMPAAALLALVPALIPIAIIATAVTVEMAKTQQISITKQLEHGARVLDIRGGYFYINSDTDPKDLWINHKLPMLKIDSSSPTDNIILKIEDAIAEVNSFLSKHPSETVVLNLSHEGFVGGDKAKELIQELVKGYSHSWGKFVYYTKGQTVPTLRDARGKCIVLCSDYDDTVTPYENNWNIDADKKVEYLYKFFEDHNKGNQLYSNKGAQYKEDKFCDDGLRNEDPKRTGDAQVQMVNYTANKPLTSLPDTVANAVKPKFTDKYFLPEVRYGWIGQDFIGDGRDPVNGIIFSNIGSTNYYIDIDETDFTYPFWFNNRYVDLVGRYTGENGETLETSIDLSKYETKVVEETIDGKTTLKASVIGLPLYAPNGEKYNYTTKVDDRYKLVDKKTEKDDNYKISDGKWCGREIRESAKIVVDVTTYPMEIQYIVDEGVSFTEPTNQNELLGNGICKALVFERTNTVTKKVDYVDVSGYYETDFETYLENFEPVSDSSGNYYKTEVKNFLASSSDGEPYSYKLKDILFRQFDISSVYYTGEVVPGSQEGILRAVIYVKDKAARKDVPGQIIWRDGGDAYNKREQVATTNRGGIFNGLKMRRTSSQETQEWSVYESGYKKITTTGNTTDFTVDTYKYDSHGNDCTCTFEYEDSYLDGYYKKVAIDGADANTVAYALHGNADFTVVWNGEVPSGITERTVNIAGTTYNFTAYNTSETSIDYGTDLGAAKVWKSETQMLPLFIDGSTSSANFHINKTDDLNVSNFVCTTDVICDVDENGVPVRHFMLYYDSTKDQTTVSGTVTWIDGGEDTDFIESGEGTEPTNLGDDIDSSLAGEYKQHIEWSKENIHVFPYVDGKKGEEVNISSMKWFGNHYSISLPKYTTDSKEITYKVEMPEYKPSRYIKFNKTQSDNTYDIKYTRMIAVKLVTNNNGLADITRNVDQLKFYKNGVETSATFEKDRMLYNDQPIADDNNIRYSYDIQYNREDSNYITDHKSSGWNDDQLRWEVEIYKYKIAEIDLPVSLTVEGSKSTHDYKFILTEGVDVISNNILVLKENTTGKFTLSGKNMTETGRQYQFDVYQQIPTDEEENMIYDTHVSCVYVTTTYGDEDQKLKLEWTDLDEKEAKMSMFTNTNIAGKMLALYEDENDYVLDEVIFNEGEQPSTTVVPHMPETEEYIYVFEKWNKIETRPADVEKAHGWPEAKIAVYQPVFKEVPKYVTVTFIDEDGTVLDTHSTKYGEVPEYKGKEPTKPSDKEYIYPFDEWNPILTPITKDTVFKAVYGKEPVDYKFIKGDGSVYKIKSLKGLEFRVNGPKDYLVNIQLDFKDIEPEMIATSSDETGFILQPEILEKLREGEHLLTAEYRNGSVPIAVFAVKEDPNTGDPNNIILWMILLLVGIGGIIFAATWGRRRN